MLGTIQDIDFEKEVHNLYKMFLAGQEMLMKIKGTRNSTS